MHIVMFVSEKFVYSVYFTVKVLHCNTSVCLETNKGFFQCFLKWHEKLIGVGVLKGKLKDILLIKGVDSILWVNFFITDYKK